MPKTIIDSKRGLFSQPGSGIEVRGPVTFTRTAKFTSTTEFTGSSEFSGVTAFRGGSRQPAVTLNNASNEVLQRPGVWKLATTASFTASLPNPVNFPMSGLAFLSMNSLDHMLTSSTVAWDSIVSRDGAKQGTNLVMPAIASASVMFRSDGRRWCIVHSSGSVKIT